MHRLKDSRAIAYTAWEGSMYLEAFLCSLSFGWHQKHGLAKSSGSTLVPEGSVADNN